MDTAREERPVGQQHSGRGLVLRRLLGPDGDAASLLFAQFAFLEFLAFFGVLLLGFAYLWRRGDLEWVRTL